MIVRIYTLSDPLTGEIRYIGKTKHPLNIRCSQHTYDKAVNHRTNWIKSLSRIGTSPKIELLDISSDTEASEIERYWIAQFKAWGFDLVNQTSGGEGAPGRIVSEETKLKHSKAMIKTAGRKVHQYDLQGNMLNTFDSVAEASDKTGASRTKIVAVCKGRRKMTAGFQWAYEHVNMPPYLRGSWNRGKSLSPEHRASAIKNLKGYKPEWEKL